MKWKTFFVKIWWKKEIVMVYLSQIMPSCVNLNLSSPKMWAKFTHIHFSSPKIWAKNEPRSWVNWKKDHSRSHLPSSVCSVVWFSKNHTGNDKNFDQKVMIFKKNWAKMMILQQFGKNWWRIIIFGPIFFFKIIVFC